MKHMVNVVLMAALLMGVPYSIGKAVGQSLAVQTSATVKVTCMSDGTMKLASEPKP